MDSRIVKHPLAEFLLTQLVHQVFQALARGGARLVEPKDCLYKRQQTLFRNALHEQKAWRRFAPKATGNPNVEAEVLVFGWRWDQTHVLDQVSAAGRVRLDTDLEFFWE
jgi:hypothetical protein